MNTPQERMQNAEKDYQTALAENDQIRQAVQLLKGSRARLAPLSDYYFGRWLEDLNELEDFNELENLNELEHLDVMGQDTLYDVITERYNLMRELILIGAEYINAGQTSDAD